MNIAFISSSFLSNRKEATWLTLTGLADSLQSLGHAVYIFAKSNINFPEIEKVNGIEIYRIDKSRFLGAGKKISEIAGKKKISFDIIHGFSSSPLMVLKTYSAAKFFPKALTVHTIKSYSKSFLGNKLYRILNSMDCVTTSTMTAKKKLSAAGCREDKIKVVLSPINIQKFIPRNKSELKHKYGYAGKKIILYYGSLLKSKGVNNLIEALPQVVQENQDVIVVFAIRSKTYEARDYYLKMVQKLNCGKNVEMITRDVKIEEYVSMADVVVLAYPTLSGTEGNPSCLFEAMASGTPVVTTKLPELTEILTDGEDVIMAETNNSRSLAEKINFLLGNQEVIDRVINNGLNKSQDFDFSRVVIRFLEIYNNR